MTTDILFQWVKLKQDIPNSSVKTGDCGVIVDLLPSNQNQLELGYTLEIFKDGETVDIVSVPSSWVTPLFKVWGQPAIATSDLENQDESSIIWYPNLPREKLFRSKVVKKNDVIGNGKLIRSKDGLPGFQLSEKQEETNQYEQELILIN